MSLNFCRCLRFVHHTLIMCVGLQIIVFEQLIELLFIIVEQQFLLQFIVPFVIQLIF